MNKSVLVGPVTVDFVNPDEVTRTCLDLTTRRPRHPCWVSNLNGYAVDLAFRDALFARAQAMAALRFCDGRGLALILGALGWGVPPQVTYNRWFAGFLIAAAQAAQRVYLLGDTASVVHTAATTLKTEHAGLIAGYRDGFFRFNAGWGDVASPDEYAVVRDINESGADILVVAMGMPRQEQFIVRHLDGLNVGLVLNGGACLKFLTGAVPTAPRWLSRAGLEWCYRCAHEPRRLWRRYLCGNPRVVAYLTLARIRQLLTGSHSASFPGAPHGEQAKGLRR